MSKVIFRDRHISFKYEDTQSNYGICTHVKIRRPPRALYKARLICIVIRWSLTGQPYMKSFTHMSCKFIRLLEKSFSSSKTMPAYLQYGKELFASWLSHSPLTGLPGPDPSLISHPCDILGRRIHNCIPS